MAGTLSGTLPKSTSPGIAAAVTTPLPRLVYDSATQEPPPTGHSNTLVVPDTTPAAVGVSFSITVQVPGPVKPPPTPQVPKSKLNGTLMPVPEASSVRKP